MKKGLLKLLNSICCGRNGIGKDYSHLMKNFVPWLVPRLVPCTEEVLLQLLQKALNRPLTSVELNDLNSQYASISAIASASHASQAAPSGAAPSSNHEPSAPEPTVDEEIGTVSTNRANTTAHSSSASPFDPSSSHESSASEPTVDEEMDFVVVQNNSNEGGGVEAVWIPPASGDEDPTASAEETKEEITVIQQGVIELSGDSNVEPVVPEPSDAGTGTVQTPPDDSNVGTVPVTNERVASLDAIANVQELCNRWERLQTYKSINRQKRTEEKKE